MRRNVMFLSILAVLLLLSGLSLAQDPIGPDSAWIDCTPPDVFVPPGPSIVSFDLKLKTDNTGTGKDITGVGAALLITVDCPDKATLDTIPCDVYVGTFCGTDSEKFAFPQPGWGIHTTFVPTNGGNPSMFPLTYVLGLVRFTGTGMLNGTFTLAHLIFSLTDTCCITIDTTHTQTVQGISITTSDVSSYVTRWAPGGQTCCVGPYVNIGGPACTSPASKSGLSGSEIVIAVSADDPDVLACDQIASCNAFVAEGSVNAPVFDPPCGGGNTYSGTVKWQTTAAESGTYHLVTCYTDNCQATVCCTTEVNLVSKCLFADIGDAIGRPGSKVTVPITIEASGTDVGGFTFCIEYDPVMLTFVSLERGEFFNEAGPFLGSYKWHYLVWRNNPSTVIHKFKLCVVGIGKLYYYDGKCMARGDVGTLNLTFRLASNELYRCFRTNIIWERLDPECIVNAFSDCSGTVTNVADTNIFFDPQLCPGLFPKNQVVPCVRLTDGGVVFRCQEDPLVRGDINCNGFANEIGDAVCFANYFLTGSLCPVPPECEARQVNATDINADGLTLSVADLVYLLRILSGDQAPLGGAKLTPLANTVDMLWDGKTVTSNNTVDLGAAWFVFKGEATRVVPEITGLEVKSGISNGETRVLVYGMNKAKIASGSTKLFRIFGDVELTKVEAAEYYSAAVNVNIVATAGLPQSFALSQNYPNPFNASTTIRFALPVDSKVGLKIYNVAGQLVKEYSEEMTAGFKSITWDGTNMNGDVVASGVYFYKLQAANFAKTLKMTLLK